MGIFDDLGSFWNWLTTSSPNPGGSAGGTPYLGTASPTASTQTPSLGGAPAGGGGLFGLLGGQQPAVNPMSYFQPQGQGLLGFGNTPLGGMIRGGLEGLAGGAGYGGLTGMGMAAAAVGPAELQRRQAQMQAVLGGQQYQKGQYDLISSNINNQFTLMRVNAIRKAHNLPELAMNDLMTNPFLATNPLGGQAPAPGAPPAQTATAVPATPSPQMQPIIAPSATNRNVALAYGGLGSGGVTDPSRGPSWGAPSGVADPTMTAAPSVSPPIPVTGQPPSPPPQQPTQQQPTQQQPTQQQQPASAQPDIYAGEQAYVDQLGNNAYTPEQLDAYYKAAAALEDKRAQTAQAVQTAQATAAANYASAPDTYKRIMDVGARYTSGDAYKAYHEVLPYYQSGMAAYRARSSAPGGPATSDYDLVNAVVHMSNPAITFKPGAALSATDLQTVPALARDAIQKLFGDGTALDKPTADRLMDSLNRNMAPRQAAYNQWVGANRAQAHLAVAPGQPDPPEVMWRGDMPPPPPPTATINGKKLELQNGTYDYTTGKWVIPLNPQWLPQ